jgi:hypothetical protein
MDAGGVAGMSHAPSLHSLGVLGLRPVPPPVPSHASAAPTQPPSLGMRDVEKKESPPIDFISEIFTVIEVKSILLNEKYENKKKFALPNVQLSKL